ncbi:unannotated protein [freshwater metagenome]|uniref:Unannotated protein n=1 Tax=freshwater metagenome TaxID=449393 RepID=A0A6J6SGX9_9ZZZZ
MGGVRLGDRGRRAGRRDHARGHAAQLHPAHHHPRGTAREAGGRPRRADGRRRLLGRCGAGQPGRPRAALGGRGVRLQVLPGALGRRRVPPVEPAAVPRRAARDRALRRTHDRARRGRARAGAGPRPAKPGLRRLRAVPTGCGRGRGDPTGPRRLPGDRGPGARAAPVERPRARPDRRRTRRGAAGHGGDLPALPLLRGGDHPRRRTAVQVLPADPRRGQPRGALAGPARRCDRHDRQ